MSAAVLALLQPASVRYHTFGEYCSWNQAGTLSLVERSAVALTSASLAQGERGTWAKMSAIQANCGIELTIDACLAQLTNSLKKKRATAEARSPRHSLRTAPAPSPGMPVQQMLRARTPSWINLQAYGEAPSLLSPRS